MTHAYCIAQQLTSQTQCSSVVLVNKTIAINPLNLTNLCLVM